MLNKMIRSILGSHDETNKMDFPHKIAMMSKHKAYGAEVTAQYKFKRPNFTTNRDLLRMQYVIFCDV